MLTSASLWIILKEVHFYVHQLVKNRHDILTDSDNNTETSYFSVWLSTSCVCRVSLESCLSYLCFGRPPLCLFTSRIREREWKPVTFLVVFQCVMSLTPVVLLAECVYPDASLSRDHQPTSHHQYWYGDQANADQIPLLSARWNEDFLFWLCLSSSQAPSVMWPTESPQ